MTSKGNFSVSVGCRGDREKQQLSARKPESDDCKKKKKKQNPHILGPPERGALLATFPSSC